MKYKVEISKKALKQLKDLPASQYDKVRRGIYALADNPRGHNSIKLADTENEYRLRVGNYRILYTIEDKILYIFVFEVADRKDAYR